MRAIKAQYFFTFAVMGAVLPYLSVYLREQGLSNNEIGAVLSTQGLAILLSPVALTLLADTRLESKHLLAGAFAVTGLMLAFLMGAGVFWTILIAHALYSLALAPLSPLQDGLNFHAQAQRRHAGLPIVPYHRIRVWGTVGFIAPSVVLYFWLAARAPISAAIVAGIILSALGAIAAFALPRTRAISRTTLPPAEVPGVEANARHGGRSRLPTVEAAKAMLQPHMLAFCLAMWLCHLAAAGYYAFYPLYLTETVGIAPQWVGLIANIGVAIEIFFMLGFGWLVHKLSFRGLLAISAAATAGRFALLAMFPTVAVAVGTQVLHGPMVLLIHVAPPIYLNERAGPTFRSSMQGLYAVAIYGTGRVIGNVAAGYIAEFSIPHVFTASVVVTVLAAALFVFAFKNPTAEQETG